VSDERPEEKGTPASFLRAALRIPVDLLQLPLDLFLYGLNRLAETAKDSLGRSAPPYYPPETAVAPAPELLVFKRNRETRPDPGCLRGDSLKLVRSRILFIKRGYEYAFPAQEDLIADDLKVEIFEAWKIAEFVQRMADAENAPLIPSAWAEYPPAACCHANGRLRRFPAGDAKYLRVFFEVLNYYPREELRYRETQLRLLREIGEALDNRGEPRGEAAGR